MLDDDDDTRMIMPMSRLALIKALFLLQVRWPSVAARSNTRRKREKIEARRKYGMMRLAFFARPEYETFKSVA